MVTLVPDIFRYVSRVRAVKLLGTSLFSDVPDKSRYLHLIHTLIASRHESKHHCFPRCYCSVTLDNS